MMVLMCAIHKVTFILHMAYLNQCLAQFPQPPHQALWDTSASTFACDARECCWRYPLVGAGTQSNASLLGTWLAVGLLVSASVAK